MNVFERYAPFIQDYIYRSGWQALRGVQNAAGEAIFGTEENVLLTASTPSSLCWTRTRPTAWACCTSPP